MKRQRYCLNQVSDVLYGRQVTRRANPIEFVTGIERHKSGWPHSHALLRIPNVDLADRARFDLGYWQREFTRSGGFCWLARPRCQAHVVSYVTKYVTKDGELEFSDNLQPIEHQGSLQLPGAVYARRPDRAAGGRPPIPGMGQADHRAARDACRGHSLAAQDRPRAVQTLMPWQDPDLVDPTDQEDPWNLADLGY